MAQSKPAEQLAPPQPFDSQQEDVRGVNVSNNEVNADVNDYTNHYAQQAKVTEIDGKERAFEPTDAQQPLALSPEQLAEIEQRYGVTLEQLTAQPSQQNQPAIPQQQVPPTTAPQQQQPQITQEQLDAANEAYKKSVGIDPTTVYNDLRNMRNELQQVRQERYIEKQTSLLRNEWGNDYDSRMERVYNHYNSMPDANKQALNSMSIVDAAKMVYAVIQQEDMNNGNQKYGSALNHGRQTPTGVETGGNKKVYTYADIMAMDTDTYYSAEVRKAFSEGRVRY